MVVAWHVSCVTVDSVAGSETPAVRSVSLVTLRILDTVVVVDELMVDVQLPIVCVLVLKPLRTKTEVRVVCPEQRSAVLLSSIVAQNKRKSVFCVLAYDSAASGPSFMISLCRDRVGRR